MSRPKSQDLRELIDECRQPKKVGQDALTFQEVADACGIARSYLYLLMRGASRPSLRVSRMLSAGLGIPRDRILRSIRLTQRRAAKK